jgi:hypothetical protein
VLYVLMRLTLNPAAARLSCRSVDAFTLAGYSTTSVPPGTCGSSLPITLPSACTAAGSSTQEAVRSGGAQQQHGSRDDCDTPACCSSGQANILGMRHVYSSPSAWL